MTTSCGALFLAVRLNRFGPIKNGVARPALA